jgi:hypothetical protein
MYRLETLIHTLSALRTAYSTLFHIDCLHHNASTAQTWIVRLAARDAPVNNPCIVLTATHDPSNPYLTNQVVYSLQQCLDRYAAYDHNDDDWVLKHFTLYFVIGGAFHLPSQYDGSIQIEDVDGDKRRLWMRQLSANGAYYPHPDHPDLMLNSKPGICRVMREGTLNPPPINKAASSGRFSPLMTRELCDFLALLPPTQIISLDDEGGWCTTSNDHPDDMWQVRLARLAERNMGYSTQYTPSRVNVPSNCNLFVMNPDSVYKSALSGIKAFARATSAEDLSKININDQLVLREIDQDNLWFSPWQPFEHPQFGAVEIGGWDVDRIRYNPPSPCVPKALQQFDRWFQAVIEP